MSEVVVSVVIPTHNRWEKLERLLVSVLASDLPSGDLEIIVVADNCADETIGALTAEFQDIKLIVTPVAVEGRLFGSAKSRQIGAAIATAPYVCFIDDDNIVDSQMLNQLVESIAADDSIGVVGPIMMRWPRGSGLWCAGMIQDRFGFNHYLRRENIVDASDESGLLAPCDFIPNVFCSRKSTLLNVPMDVSRFPHNGSELDWGIRIQEAGLSLRISTRAKVWHDLAYRSLTTRIESCAMVHDQARSRVIQRYVHPQQFGPTFVFWLFWFPLISGYFLAKFIQSRRLLSLTKAYVEGTIDGWRISKLSSDF